MESKKVIWICGAKSGIGKAVAEKFISSQNIVYLSSRDGSVDASFSTTVKALKCDVRNFDDWLLCAKQIQEEQGRLDLFIYNAGDCVYVSDTEVKHQDFEYMMDVNFYGLVKASEVLIPLLEKSPNGHFVGMTSSVAWLALPRAEAYGSSKSAAHYFLKSLRLGLKKRNIDISIVCPGFVKTPLTDKNDFPMPCLVSSEYAAEQIYRGVNKRKKTIHFPKRFTLVVKAIALLPSFLEEKITGSLTK